MTTTTNTIAASAKANAAAYEGTIAAYAKTAPKAHHAILGKLSDAAIDATAARLSAPEWAQDAMVSGNRVPVAVKVAHDGLTVDTWTSKSGKAMSRVHWADGRTTEYADDLAHVYVAWDR